MPLIKTVKVCLIILGLLPSFVIHFAQASELPESITVAFGQYKEPYVIQETDRGIEVDIIKEVFARVGVSINALYIPYKNLEEALETFPSIDAAAGVSTRTLEQFTYIPNFSFFNNVIVSKTRNNIEINSFSDLTEYSLLAWQGAASSGSALGEEFIALFGNAERSQDKYFELSNQYQQNAMFWSDRVDLVLLDEHIFEWYRRPVGMVLDVSDEVTYHRLWNESHSTSVVFKDEELADIFRQGLAALKESGQYRAIYDRYRSYN
ncbi:MULTISPECIES: ABC transporter substrate-binding protein [Gammaproteobacteria]|uniref:substrate-binding periplasmic protein n=1 Tax=Gammaproteobacteria TaxID=1236 RepID=UPI000DCFDCBE|nr:MULTISPECIES: transporter substrate-binding domain-containing protein [Gammaproteobacteria]RTE87657.1 transporter substrate-binding domain-containing protein [Aliidiomarina sp. B3213]TCZ92559.1 transporter substrate-binding domain-containing protein [Lysobacter sp. N42]